MKSNKGIWRNRRYRVDYLPIANLYCVLDVLNGFKTVAAFDTKKEAILYCGD